MKKIEGKRIAVGVRVPEAEHYQLKQVVAARKTTVQAILLAAIQAVIQR